MSIVGFMSQADNLICWYRHLPFPRKDMDCLFSADEDQPYSDYGPAWSCDLSTIVSGIERLHEIKQKTCLVMLKYVFSCSRLA